MTSTNPSCPPHLPVSIRLAVLSDDFTGALDTGVQFAKRGVTVRILTEEEFYRHGLAGQPADVLVVDAETRHASPAEAYRVTRELTARILDGGVPYLYLKTDSGLRGNIGSVLKAALDAGRLSFLPFLPAFPAMNRVTRDGRYFVNGQPIHESPFGDDPFEPVRSPYVADLFREQGTAVRLYPAGGAFETDCAEPTIGIFDASVNEDFHRAAEHLHRRGQLRVTAGCAGFASVLPGYIGLSSEPAPPPVIPLPLLVVCGSLNAITRRQIAYAESRGFVRRALAPRQLLEPGYFDSAESAAWIDSLQGLFESGKNLIFDTGTGNPGPMEQYAAAHPETAETARETIAGALGEFTRRLLERGCGRGRTLMAVGGDTLLGILRRIGWKEISPVGEIALGTVVSTVRTNTGTLPVVSKSGGFGQEDLLVRVARSGAASSERREIL